MLHTTSAVRVLCLGAGLSLATLAAPSPAAGQAKVQLTPFFASFYALGHYGTGLDDGNGGTFDEKLTNAPAVGARLSFLLSRAVGIEGSFTYAWTGRQGSEGKDPAGVVTSGGVFIPGNAIMASGRITLHPRRSNFRAILGVGYQKRGGEAWDEAQLGLPAGTFDKTSIGGVVGFGVKASVTPKFALDLDVEAFLYSNDADTPAGPTFDKKFQQDVTVAIGVPISFGGH